MFIMRNKMELSLWTHGVKLMFLFFIFTEFPQKIDGIDCPDVKDQAHSMLKIDSMCYHYIETTDQRVTYATAEPDCKSRGGHLVTIKNNKTQAELVRVLQEELQVSSHTVLIGLRRQGSVWKWVTGDELSYSNWESTTTCQDCGCAKMTLRLGGLWEKFNCQTSDWYTAYVCEYDPTSNGSGHSQGRPFTFPILSVLSAFIAVAMALFWQ